MISCSSAGRETLSPSALGNPLKTTLDKLQNAGWCQFENKAASESSKKLEIYPKVLWAVGAYLSTLSKIILSDSGARRCF